MEYTQGSLGRVFVARLHGGESIYEAVEEIATREGIKTATVLAVGGIREGKAVVGPENPEGKVVPRFAEFDNAREIIGVGTVFPQDGKPSLHFHGGMGHGEDTIVGCLRSKMSVYLVLEVFIIEVLGIDAGREMDPEFGVKLLSIAG